MMIAKVLNFISGYQVRAAMIKSAYLHIKQGTPAVKDIQMDLSFNYPSYFIILCLLAGLVYALTLYYNSQSLKDSSRSMRIILGSIRGLLIAGIVFLLIGPLIRTSKSNTQKPLLLIGQDVSRSVLEPKINPADQEYQQKLDRLISSLESDFDIRMTGIGEIVYEQLPDSFSDQLTDLSAQLKYWNDLFEYQPVGGAILATDGIYNSGISPVYETYKLKGPLHTIALGDTNTYPDLKIARVLYNEVMYLDDEAFIEAEIAADQLKNARTNVILEKKTNGNWRRLDVQQLDFRGNGIINTSFRIKANDTGINEYRIRVSPVEKEKVRANNYFTFFIDVIDSRQKIYLIAASPHPDITAIKQWLSNDKRYEISVGYVKNGFEVPAETDLVIFHQLPQRSISTNELMKELNARKTPRFFITGRQTALPQFNQAQDLVTITGSNQQMNEAQPLVDKDFRLFTLEDETRQRLNQFPPLSSFFGNYQVSPAGNTLMYQRISNIETDYPLLIMGETDGLRAAALLGEGIWRWRLYDYLQHNNDEISREWFVKTIQYLTIIEDKSPFRVVPIKKIFAETEDIEFDARLYNANYELVNDVELPMVITDSTGAEFTFYFDKRGDRYALNAGRFPPGQYRYRSSFSWNNKNFTDAGSFSVQAISLESNELRADHQVLFQLSEQNNGSVYYPEQLDQLSEDLKTSNFAKPVMVATTQTFPFISLKWVFFVLLALLTLEWVVRRIYGGL